MSKIFLDANILLDILIPDRPNHQQALQAYTKICDRYDILSTSENILTTIEYIASRNKISCIVVYQFFQKLTTTFELYHFTDILKESLEIYNQKCKQQEKIDFEDLLQLKCAIKNSCDAFLTEDKSIKKMGQSIKILGLNDIIHLN